MKKETEDAIETIAGIMYRQNYEGGTDAEIAIANRLGEIRDSLHSIDLSLSTISDNITLDKSADLRMVVDAINSLKND